ncbi:MAG TPA: putative Ig domain-containing protein [Candidatus Angelobacter sp.]|nr:putative Ig domain-containing protein [Candidatus Angelobacter sp.]
MTKRIELFSILALALVFTGCGLVNGGGGRPVMGISTTSLPSAVQGMAYSAALQAIGGKAPYTWSMSGTMPTGVVFNSNGNIAGTPTALGTSSFSVQVTDSSSPQLTAQLPLSITVNPVLSITTTLLPSGLTGNSYKTKLKSNGGVSPVSWTIVSGSLPAGLTMDAGGTISGTPTTAGTSGFTVQATDASTTPQAQQADFTINIGTPTPLSITTTSLPNGIVNTAYSATVQSTGGIPPISWSITTGALPPGLTLDPNFGVISGTPTTVGTTGFTVQAADSSTPQQTAQAALSITRTVGPLKITTTSLPAGTVGNAYSASLQANGGTPPITWSVSVGSLPAGLTLNASTGAITGTPTAAATTGFTVTATDTSAPVQSAQQALSIIVAPPGNNDAELSGQYAFLFQGFDASGPVAIAGSFVADGKGNLTSGIEDINRTSGVSAGMAFSGTYLVNADSRGTMTLSNTQGTSTFSFALGSIVTGVASLGHVIEFDATGTNVAGVIKKQDTTAFSSAAISGNYATGMSGAGPTGLAFSLAGSFTANGAGTISAGDMDTKGVGLVAADTPFTGTYTVAATGRGTSTFSVGTAVINQAFYVISANELMMISTDPLSATNAIYGGSALKQAAGSFTNASLNGASVLAVEGFSNTGVSNAVTIQVGVITAAGNGSFTISADSNKAGVLGPISASGTYTVAANGRTPITDITHSWTIYLVGPNQGFVVDQNPSATSGTLQPQSGGPFSAASLSGSFIFSDGPPAGKTSTLQSGVASPNGVSSVSGTFDQNKAGVLSGSMALTDTYTVAANGRVVLSGSQQIMYIISPSKAVVVNSDPTNTSPNLRFWDK